MRFAALIAALSAVALASGCGDSSVASPFIDGGGPPDGAGNDAGQEAGPVDGGDDGGEGLGGPCVADEQCDDGIDCTFDECDDVVERCRFTPDDSACADDVFCDGAEVCDPKLGCRDGVPRTCGDESTCTIDTCVEADRSCTNVARDADGDGDPDWHCGGDDCNDTDPLVSGDNEEVCDNGKDDDCDGDVDEEQCSGPLHDTCLDPLEITAAGNYQMDATAASPNYSASCLQGNNNRDVVAAVLLDGAPGPRDVDVTASVSAGQVALASAQPCGQVGAELGCAPSIAGSQGAVSRLVLRSLAPDNYPIYVFTTSAQPVSLKVDIREPKPAPSNETCGTSQPLAFGQHVTAELAGTTTDVPTTCTAGAGDLVYELTLDAPADVTVTAASLDGVGQPTLSLRDADCASLADELACSTGVVARIFRRALPAGTYHLAVSATGPSDIDVVAERAPPTTPGPDETCSSAPALEPGVTVDVDLTSHTDDIALGCAIGAVDAAYRLDLSERSDVLLVERLSTGDFGAVSLALDPCTDPSQLLACGTSNRSPARAAEHDVSAGSYRAVVESQRGNPVSLTAFTRAAVAPVFVVLADECADAVEIPATGGFFQGNTANAGADYDAGCDLGGQAPGGARDQMLKLVLAERRRVVFDMKGSSYSTLLDVRRGPACPGTEVVQACAAGYVADRSYLDLVLDPGEYWVQIDGYAGADGAWFLDVFTADP